MLLMMIVINSVPFAAFSTADAPMLDDVFLDAITGEADETVPEAGETSLLALLDEPDTSDQKPGPKQSEARNSKADKKEYRFALEDKIVFLSQILAQTGCSLDLKEIKKVETADEAEASLVHIEKGAAPSPSTPPASPSGAS